MLRPLVCAVRASQLTLLQEHALSPDIYSDSQESGSESEEETDDDGSYEDDEHDDLTQDSELESEDDLGHTSSESHGSSDEDGKYASRNETDGDNAQQDKVFTYTKTISTMLNHDWRNLTFFGIVSSHSVVLLSAVQFLFYCK